MGMVDISKKKVTQRLAVVEGKVFLKPSVIRAIKKNKIPKGNVLESAKLAGILAAKQTSHLLPMCHPISIDFGDIEFLISRKFIKIKATLKAKAKTGVEMEALTAVSVAALTIYDMCKPVDKEIVISEIKLLKKTGGKSGAYERK